MRSAEPASLSLARAADARARGDFWSARVCLRQAFASREALGQSWAHAIRLAESIGDDHGALLAARRLYEETSRAPHSAYLLAEALTHAGKPGEGAALLAPLADAGQLSADRVFRLTRMLMLAGRLGDAHTRARALLASHAASPTLWERIAQTKRFVQNDPDIDAMRKVFGRIPVTSPAGRSAIAAALAKAYVDIGFIDKIGFNMRAARQEIFAGIHAHCP